MGKCQKSKSRGAFSFVRNGVISVGSRANLASKRLLTDKTKQEVKQDLTMSISWGKPNNENTLIEAQAAWIKYQVWMLKQYLERAHLIQKRKSK